MTTGLGVQLIMSAIGLALQWILLLAWDSKPVVNLVVALAFIWGGVVLNMMIEGGVL